MAALEKMMRLPSQNQPVDKSRFRPWRISLERADSARHDAVQALALYQQAIEKAHHEAPGTRALPICLVRLEQFYQEQQRWAEAEGVMSRLIQLYESLHGHNSLAVAVALQKQADLCIKQGKQSAALALQARANSILSLPTPQATATAGFPP